MASVVGICNIGLGKCGAGRITSLNDGTTEANLCKDNYNALRDAVLAETDWGFASKIRELPALATNPVGDYQAAYEKPSDCIRPLIFSYSPADMYPAQWEEIGSEIHASYPNRPSHYGGFAYDAGGFVPESAAGTDRGYLKYIFRNEAVGTYPPMFVEALAARIAMEFCLPLTRNKTLYDNLERTYYRKLSGAASVSGQSGNSRKFTTGNLIRVR